MPERLLELPELRVEPEPRDADDLFPVSFLLDFVDKPALRAVVLELRLSALEPPLRLAAERLLPGWADLSVRAEDVAAFRAEADDDVVVLPLLASEAARLLRDEAPLLRADVGINFP